MVLPAQVGCVSTPLELVSWVNLPELRSASHTLSASPASYRNQFIHSLLVGTKTREWPSAFKAANEARGTATFFGIPPERGTLKSSQVANCSTVGPSSLLLDRNSTPCPSGVQPTTWARCGS